MEIKKACIDSMKLNKGRTPPLREPSQEVSETVEQS